jgi:hypothetical protein
MANGPREELNAAAYDWQWNDPAEANGAWVAATTLQQRGKTRSTRMPGVRIPHTTC